MASAEADLSEREKLRDRQNPLSSLASISESVGSCCNKGLDHDIDKKKREEKIGVQGARGLQTSVQSWEVSEVARFFEQEIKTHPEIAEAIREHEIDGATLKLLNLDALHKMGIQRVGLACRFLQLRDGLLDKGTSPMKARKVLQRWKVLEDRGAFYLEEDNLEKKEAASSSPMASPATLSNRQLKCFDLKREYAVCVDGSCYQVGRSNLSKGMLDMDLDLMIEKMSSSDSVDIITKDTPQTAFLCLYATLDRLNYGEQTFDISGKLRVFWREPEIFLRGLAYEEEREEDEDESHILSSYSFTKIKLDEREGRNLPCESSSLFYGSVPGKFNKVSERFSYCYKTEVVNWSIFFRATIFSSMHLQRFPFDRQAPSIFIRTNPNWEILPRPPAAWRIPSRFRWDVAHILPDPLVEVECKMLEPWVQIDAENHRVLIMMRVQRIASFFTVNFIFPLFITASFTLSALFVHPYDYDGLANRITIILTCLLTTTAFGFNKPKEIPRLKYFSFLDKYVIANHFWYLIMVIETILASTTRTLEIDMYFGCTFAVAWLVLHIVGATGYLWLEWGFQPWDIVMTKNRKYTWKKIQARREQNEYAKDEKRRLSFLSDDSSLAAMTLKANIAPITFQDSGKARHKTGKVMLRSARAHAMQLRSKNISADVRLRAQQWMSFDDTCWHKTKNAGVDRLLKAASKALSMDLKHYFIFMVPDEASRTGREIIGDCKAQVYVTSKGEKLKTHPKADIAQLLFPFPIQHLDAHLDSKRGKQRDRILAQIETRKLWAG
eukprot:jgi/Bigna1/85411/estExt_fgenesh1_pg.C_40029